MDTQPQTGRLIRCRRLILRPHARPHPNDQRPDCCLSRAHQPPASHILHTLHQSPYLYAAILPCLQNRQIHTRHRQRRHPYLSLAQ
ncbi:hypothetical protein l11_18960 [Neisseria weaveri LMG 5135]|nr:hypothetical protein l11_18960 [Neisseria weaveri LMG 5135]EGV38095.1 hypothetical protein l13_01900 [Neisseria weaveri ATCC 51223]